MSGQLIGHRYRVLRKIGEGGMAVVHLAIDEKLGRDVAIKILRERYENHDEIRIRFQHEARAISSFDHPNILKVYDFSGEESRQLWIVTELIHGRNLAQILEKRRVAGYTPLLRLRSSEKSVGRYPAPTSTVLFTATSNRKTS